ncbi:MAG TPA: AMP-dependent synthetase [Clostridiales bacterium]|nr:AMP-dependent synthetase [Clostridiales bacterium]
MDRQTNILEYLDHIVGVCPDKPCYANESEALTFRQVYDDARAIGTGLIQMGCCRQPVVVFMKRHPRTIVSFLGTVYAGCYYVPIDEEIPEYRIEMIFQTLQPEVVLCDESTSGLVSGFSYYQGKILLYDEITRTKPNDLLLQGIRDRAIDTDPIYIVFTSGSTGVPKGVVACHRSVIDYIESFSEVMRFDRNTIFGMQVPLYVDACLKEIYPTLKYGATAFIIPKELFMFPLKLVHFLNEHRINTVCWVVPALTMISGLGVFDQVIPEYLHTIAAGSEVFPMKQFMLWQKTLPNARFLNLYGPTEATGMSCWYEADRPFTIDDVLPIGKPFRNTEIMLLNEQNQLVAPGQPGEICIRGTALTMGYYKAFDKTQECFVQNPLNRLYPELVYRTGDIGRYNDKGELLFMSRKDYQIKHMGHRIELGEIEMVVNKMEGILQSCALFDDERKKILLFFAGNCSKAEVIEYAKQKLPRYMIPNLVEQLEIMPLTNNGKINRLLLKQSYTERKRS